jgi:hypothetical protein
MTDHKPKRLRQGLSETIHAAIAFATISALASVAHAQSFRPAVLGSQTVVEVQGEVASEETVWLLHGLAKIESDVRLGMLFAHAHVKDPSGSHLSDPHEEIWPEIKDKLIAAGATDFDALLLQLEEARDEKAVLAVGSEVIKAIVKARDAIHPTEADIAASVVELTREVRTEINHSGPTELASYQDAWSMLNVARSEVDLLLHAKDPAIAKAAIKMVLALDEVIIFMPDPEASGPVEFDVTVIDNAVAILEGLVAGGV